MSRFWNSLLTQTAFILAIYGCTHPAHPPSDSATNGAVTGGTPTRATASEVAGRPILPRPRDPGPSVVKIFTKSLMKKVPCTNHVDEAQKLFFGSYMNGIEKWGGVPREKMWAELREALVNNNENRVMAKRLDVKNEDDINNIMDEMLWQAGSLPDSQKRRSAVSSLTPEPFYEHPNRDVNNLNIVLHHPPFKIPLLPTTPSPPPGILSEDELIALGGKDFVGYVKEYTNFGSKFLRAAETSPEEDSSWDDMTSDDLKRYQKWSQVINDTLTKLPVVNTPVYRGMRHIQRAELQHWITLWLRGGTVSLGQQNKPATCSATWNIGVTRKFYRKMIPDSGNLRKYFGVLLELHNHQGVGIENISRISSEGEVLIGKDRKFRIEEISGIEGVPEVVYMKLVGLDTPSQKSADLNLQCAH